MTDDPRRDDSPPLDGWKAIAGHLGKSVRTAQRWRSEFGMPVHRIGDRDREHVYAYRSELDDWRRRASHFVGPEPGAADDQLDALGESRPAEPKPPEQARTPPPHYPTPRRLPRGTRGQRGGGGGIWPTKDLTFRRYFPPRKKIKNTPDGAG